ncbi:VWA domain-containing protein [Myxococcus sp. K15C18031901]|uniref:vWA domain-containing protein n=1 Tax=Myxococcus dinghuensis TaxID=2906761 RepID=UPI0020A799EA|nr:vWA domain-containing protein [Myxococcus dinghuensis]MCP3100229.1 VWA domain-containing protein [Myxococcus dinghuensis]
MSKRGTLGARTTPWFGTALLCLLVATQAAAAAKAPARGEPPYVDRCECGPLDVVFAIDDTGSMGGSLASFQAGFSTLLSQIQISSNGDYRLGLVTFKDDVTVVHDLAAGNDVAVSTSISTLFANGGWGAPEASDEALNTVVNNLGARAGQTGNFFGYWRTGARRVVILITDNLPGGFNDNYTGPALANAVGAAAGANGIKIHAVYVPTSGTPDPTAVSIMQGYATASNGLFRQTAPNGSDAALAVQDFLSDCRQPSDVFIRDTPADNGYEPSTGSIYMSPDIKVCNNVNGCGTSTNPVYGSPNNYVFVTLRNYGPNRATGPIGGTLMLYYLSAGGNVAWGSGSWNLIKAEHGIFLDAGETRDIRIPWPNVPVPGHYCLLARWVSPGDPMTYPELIGSNTVTNTQANNNIAWRNVDVIRILTGGTGTTTYDVRPPIGRALTLHIKPTKTVFPGAVALDLGERLYALWKAAGGKAEGLEGVEGTRLRFGGGGGSLTFRTQEKMDERIHLTFTSKGEAGEFPVNVFETDDKGQELGGVRYDVNVLSPDTAPFPVDLAARLDREAGVVALTWPHAVHHKAYRIYRTDKLDGTRGEAIGGFEVDAATTETTALRFFDKDSAAGKRFYYSVESISGGGSTFSDFVTPDSLEN